MKKTNLMPLILDLAEKVDVVYDKSGRQVCFAGTTQGTYDEHDSAGPD